MKLTAFFIFIASLQLNAKGYSQTVTLSLRNVPLQKVFKLIQKQTGYNFLYTNELLDEAGKVSIEIQNGNLLNALQISLEKTDLTYSILEGTVVIKKKPPVIGNLKLTPDGPPPIQISGRITNEQGEPLQNVSIVLKGTQIGTATDAKGYYTIDVPDNSSKILIFSFVGMGTQEISVSKSSAISLIMKTVSGPEQEVVVRGYGTQKKVNLTGSVASIGGDQIQNRPVTTISGAIQGELPGVQVVTPSGQPGRDNGIIKIRGVGTMNDADPMIVIDGLVSTTMDDLNPNDIESISVLKDASASAIYGSRAANGVILVTTKRGRLGKPRVSYNGYLGRQSFTATKQFLDSYNYALLLNEGLTNEGLPVKYTDAEIEKFRTGSDPVNYPNTNWMSLLHQGTGNQQNHNVSVSGGNESSRYLLSLGYLDQSGLLVNTSTKRYNIRFNLDSKVSDHLAVGITSSLSRQNIIEPSGGLSTIISETERTPPVLLNKNPDGTWAHYDNGNFIETLDAGGLLNEDVSHVNGNIFAELTIIKGLKLRATAGVDYLVIDSASHVTDVTFGDGLYQGPSSLTDAFTRSTRVILQSLLTYQTNVGNHNISGLLGVERESNRFDADDAFRANFPSNSLTELNGGDPSTQTNSGYEIQNNLGSYFGRVNYDYKGKYLVEGTMRYDGSSKFAEDKRWGLFPSFSAGWRISEEPFFKRNVPLVNNFKLRGSYGSVGNNATTDYQYLPIVALGLNYPFFGQISPGAAQIAANNPQLEWEKSTSLNIGADLGFFNDKLTLTADYYNRLTTNILLAVPVSVVFGLPAPTVNEGALRNKGFEFLLGYKNKVGAFSYHSSFNISFNQNRVEKFGPPAIGAVGAFGSLYTTIRAVGYQWDEFYGLQAAGIYQTPQQVANLPKIAGSPAGVGDLIFKDQNKDGIIDANDRVALGNQVPNVTFGINLGFNYKNFDLLIFGQGVTGVTQKITIQDMYAFINGAGALKRNLDRWTPQTPNSKFPKTHVTEQYNEDQLNSATLIDGSYFRLKNLQLGYTIPLKIVRRVKMDQARIYVSCSNVFTLTHVYNGIDPEAASLYDVGYDGKYNNVRVVTLGLNVNF